MGGDTIKYKYQVQQKTVLLTSDASIPNFIDSDSCKTGTDSQHPWAHLKSVPEKNLF